MRQWFVTEPAVNALGAAIYSSHRLNLMTPLLNVVLVDAYGIQPYDLRLVTAAEGFQEVEEIFSHLEVFAVHEYGHFWLGWTPDI